MDLEISLLDGTTLDNYHNFDQKQSYKVGLLFLKSTKKLLYVVQKVIQLIQIHIKAYKKILFTKF